MLAYEQCKELKDAGFPQQLTHGDWAFCVDCHGDNFKDGDDEFHLMHDDNDEGSFVGNDYRHRWEDYPEGNWVKVPTISELIAACGDGFTCLKKFAGFWRAHSSEYSEHLYDNYIGGYKYFDGFSAEEAVARLWLALNEKK